MVVITAALRNRYDMIDLEQDCWGLPAAVLAGKFIALENVEAQPLAYWLSFAHARPFPDATFLRSGDGLGAQPYRCAAPMTEFLVQ